MKKIKNIVMLAIIAIATTTATAQKAKTVMVGGAEMFPTKNIVENAVNSKDHTTLVAVVKAAGLVETLQSAGPFTVFAPVNAAFDKLPAGTVDNLLKEENLKTLQTVLTYHVIAGRISSTELVANIKAAGGTFVAKTVAGQELSFSVEGKKVKITDANGGTSFVTIADVNQSNGVIHVVDTVLLPKSQFSFMLERNIVASPQGGAIMFLYKKFFATKPQRRKEAQRRKIVQLKKKRRKKKIQNLNALNILTFLILKKLKVEKENKEKSC